MTGATGFVGAAVARALLRADWQVRAVVRGPSNRQKLDALALECVTGDLTDLDSLRRAAVGVDAVFHVAADYRLGARVPAELYRANVEGTRNVIAAARDAGVRRIVYTSSVATISLPGDGSPGHEDSPARIEDMIGHYKRSKFLAEALALEAARDGAPVVIVNPSTPVGPGDVKPTPTGQMIADAASGRMPAYVDTGLNIVHVDDVAAGHLLAYERGRIGERYILGGEDLSLREILGEIATLVGRRPPRIRLPRALVLPLAYAAEFGARVCGTSTRITVEAVRMSGKHMYYSSDKAVRELGYAWRPPSQAFADALAWLRERGALSS